MSKKNQIVDSSIKRKFIKPLNDGCEKNYSRLYLNSIATHQETNDLLRQAYFSLKDSYSCLENNSLVDACTLMRSSLEYILMAVVIEFHDPTFEEFKLIGLKERSKTKIIALCNKFKRKFKKISNNFLGDFKDLSEFYDTYDFYSKLCNFTHSSVVVCTFNKINKKSEKEILKMMIMQNYYFLKILLFYCLKYFTNDDDHYLDNYNILFSYIFSNINMNKKIQKNKVDLTKYNDDIYINENRDILKEYHNRIKKSYNIINNVTRDNTNSNDKFLLEKLKEFLK